LWRRWPMEQLRTSSRALIQPPGVRVIKLNYGQNFAVLCYKHQFFP
jgi:hypothetical protein